MWVGAARFLAASYMATDAVGSNSRPCVRGHAARNIGGIGSSAGRRLGGGLSKRGRRAVWRGNGREEGTVPAVMAADRKSGVNRLAGWLVGYQEADIEGRL